jgi:hypothetical protein
MSLAISGIVTAYTASAAISAVNGNRLFTNAGATGSVTLTLPPARVGDRFTAFVKAAYAFVINPYGTEKISAADGATMSDAGKTITADAVGEFITAECFADGEWTITATRGTWTVES